MLITHPRVLDSIEAMLENAALLTVLTQYTQNEVSRQQDISRLKRGMLAVLGQYVERWQWTAKQDDTDRFCCLLWIELGWTPGGLLYFDHERNTWHFHTVFDKVCKSLSLSQGKASRLKAICSKVIKYNIDVALARQTTYEILEEANKLINGSVFDFGNFKHLQDVAFTERLKLICSGRPMAEKMKEAVEFLHWCKKECQVQKC